MALSIKSSEADRLARDLAATTGESLTDAVTIALRERLQRERARRGASVAARLRRLSHDVRALPVLDVRSPEAILDYDERGLPR
jgi:antitoxin VapB